MPYIRQTNFLGGELDSYLWGRTDLSVYGSGARRLRNFFASKQGAAISRPGTSFIAYRKGLEAARLIPFVFSDSQSYVLEVGVEKPLNQLYVRFFTKAGVLETVPGSGTPYELTIGNVDMPFDLSLLKYAQTGDILTITHPAFPRPREIRRKPNLLSGAPVWEWAYVQFAVPAPYFGGTFDGSPNGYPVLQKPLPTPSTATHIEREWTFWVTLTVQDVETGRTFETLPFRIRQLWTGSGTDLPTTLAEDLVVLYPDKPITILRGSHAETIVQTPDYTYRELAWNVYRGRGDLIGFVGTTKTNKFVDVGDTPDYSLPPPRGTNPFASTDAAGVAQIEERVKAVAFFQERRAFAGTHRRPGWAFLSATGQYTNFDPQKIAVAGQSLSFELAARRREEIIHLLSTTQLLAGTRSSWWSIAGVQGSPLDFDSIDARMVDEIGTTDLTPLIVDGTVLYARAKGQGVRALQQDQVSWRGRDISLHSQHLFVGTTLQQIQDEHGSRSIITTKELIDWTYAEDPWGLVWAARDDGTLLSLTFTNQGSQAWARHDTQGRVLGVCAVPETNEDGVYLLVERNIGGEAGTVCVERMVSRVRRGTAEDDAAVDCAKRYEGAPTQTLTGLQHLAGNSVWVVGVNNPPQGPLMVAADGTLALPAMPTVNSTAFNSMSGDYDPIVVLFVGLLFTPEFESLDLAQGEARAKQKTVKRIGWEVDQSRGLKVGQDFEHLDDWIQRQVSDSYGATNAETIFVDAPVAGTWDKCARGCVQQSLPLPVTLLAFLREVDIGG